MKKIRVKSIWQGQVAIRDKYLEEINKTNQDLII